jgi:2-polyprenyl-3-methyl-5-hydroxy-6-metoxy-1,4-benzoquinol methylase
MISLKYRSKNKELLDADGIQFSDIKQNMQELDTVNKYLGGHRITLKGIIPFFKTSENELTICEIGCGGGDNLRAIHSFASKKNAGIKLIGIDIKEECVSYAKQRNTKLKAEWICSDYKRVDFKSNPPDIIFSSLFCHHFTDEELVEMILWMKENCKLGFFINDLQRNHLAYYSIKWLTKMFSKSYLVKNDAPLSVARGFKKHEWREILKKTGLSHFSVEWLWAFRYLIIFKK